MSLQGLHIENFFTDGFTSASSTTLYNNDGTPNANLSRRAVRLKISVQNDIEPFEGDDGYWSICTSDLTISGYQGVLTNIWATGGNPQQIHPQNPLLETEYEPAFEGNPNGNDDIFLANTPYDIPNGYFPSNGYNPGASKQYYKKFGQPQTTSNGHQSLQDFLDNLGSYQIVQNISDTDYVSEIVDCEDIDCFGDIHIWSPQYPGGTLVASSVGAEPDTQAVWVSGMDLPFIGGQPQGGWEFQGEWQGLGEYSGTIYTDQSQSASTMWNDNVKRVFMFNTVGIDYDTGRGLQGNEIDVFVILKEGVTFPNPENTITVDFDGMPQWTSLEGAGSPGMSFLPTQSNTIIRPNVTETSSDSVEVKVTINPTSKKVIKSLSGLKNLPYTHQEIINGVNPDHDRYILESKIRANKSREVAEIKFEIAADTPNGFFHTMPKLAKHFDNVKLELKSKEKTDGKVTSCTYILTRTNNLSTSTPNISFYYKTKKFETAFEATVTIDKLDVSDYIVNSEGESVVITITGTPNATFGVTVNESEHATHTHADGLSTTEEWIEHGNDVSILKKPILNTTTFHGIPDFPVLTGTIGKSGTYRFKQQIPSVISQKTKFVDAPSNEREDIIFKNLNNVKKGDRLYTKTIPGYTNITVAVLNPDGDNANELDLSANISAAAGDPVIFKRSKCYTVNLVPDLCSKLGAYHTKSKRIYQYLDPTLTINNNITGSDFKVDSDGGTSTGLANGATYTAYLNGEPLSYSTNIKSKDSRKLGSKKSFSMVLDLASGAHNWTAFKHPTKNVVNKFWTITDLCKYGGSVIDISNISISALSSNTITFSYDVEVKKWGSTDVQIDLTLNDLFTYA